MYNQRVQPVAAPPPAIPDQAYGAPTGAPYPPSGPPPPYSEPQAQPMPYTTQPGGLTPVQHPTGPPQQGQPQCRQQCRQQQLWRQPKRTKLSMFNSDWAGTSFSDKAIRRAFIRKVYLILLCQLLVTLAFVCWFIFHEPTRRFVQTHSYLYYLSYGTFIVLFIVLYCCAGVRRKVPGNYICLAIFTLSLSYMCACISSYHDTKIVLSCIGITAFICFVITLIVQQNKIDFTGGCCTAVLLVLVIILVVTAIATVVVWMTIGGNIWLQVLLGGVAALVMCLMLAIDTHMILGGGRNQLSPEEYIVAALDLYLDIVYLFMIILCMMGGGGCAE